MYCSARSAVTADPTEIAGEPQYWVHLKLLVCRLTPGNVDDRKAVPELAKGIFGKLFGDKGYISQIEHTHHRSLANFMVNLLSGLVAYCHQAKKPSLNIQRATLDLIPYP